METRFGRLLAALSIAALLTVVVGYDASRIAIAESDSAGVELPQPEPPTTLEEQFRLADRNGDKEKFLFLLWQNPSAVDLILDNSFTLLDTAVSSGNLEAVRILLQRGADPNSGEHTPVHLALLSAGKSWIHDDNPTDEQISISRIIHYEIIVELIKSGASYNFYAYELDKVSFIEDLIMEVCSIENFIEWHIEIFEKIDRKYTLDEKYLNNIEAIKTLARIGVLDPSCFNFFEGRISRG